MRLEIDDNYVLDRPGLRWWAGFSIGVSGRGATEDGRMELGYYHSDAFNLGWEAGRQLFEQICCQLNLKPRYMED